MAEKLATPVLENLSARRLKQAMPVEPAPGAVQREQFSHLEALGRLLMGIAPRLELGGGTDPEGLLRADFAELARMSIDAATDPAFRRSAEGLKSSLPDLRTDPRSDQLPDGQHEED